MLIIVLSTGEKQFYIQFYARFPNIVIIWRIANDALDEVADLYNEK